MSNDSLSRAMLLMLGQLAVAVLLGSGTMNAYAAEQCAAQCVESCQPIQNDCSNYENVICADRKRSGDEEAYRSCVLALAGCTAELGSCMESCSGLPTECAEEPEEQDQDEAPEDEREHAEEETQPAEADEDDGWREIEVIDPFGDDAGGSSGSGSGSGGGGSGSAGSTGGGSGSGGGSDSGSAGGPGSNGGDASGDGSAAGGSGSNSGRMPLPDWSGGPPRIPGWPPAGGGNTTINICVGAGACSRGDPHLVSFDGVRFDFQGAGEYHFATSADNEVDIQVRYQPASGSDVVSVGTALAARVGENRVTALLGRQPLIQINGDPVAVQEGLGNAVGHESGVILDRHGAVHRINMGRGIVISVAAHRKFMNVGVVSSELAIAGLGGSNDGNPDNEFTTRDGETVATSNSELTYEQRYRQFGDSWRVEAEDSLFDYADGENTATFANLDFPQSHRELDALDADARRNAEKTCREASVSAGPDFDDCLYDVGFTGDTSYAAGYVRSGANNIATLDAPRSVSAGSTMTVHWTGPGERRDLIAIAEAGQPADRFSTYRNVNESGEVELRVPGIPGNYELRYILAEDRRIIATVPLTVTPVTATLDAPETAAAGSIVLVRWTGPNDKRNLIAVAEPLQSADRFSNYRNVNETGEVELRIPGIPGDYELRYILAEDRQIIASKTLTVTPVTATLAAPDTVAAGSSIRVRWTGPGEKRNLITLSEPTHSADRFSHYRNVNETGEVELRVPGIPGNYELRYVLAEDRQIIATKPLTVTPVTATLAAPLTASPGTRIEVQWTGPGNQRDFVALASPDSDTDRFITQTVIKADSNTVQVRIPDVSGNYVLRYVLANDRQVIAELPISIQ